MILGYFAIKLLRNLFGIIASEAWRSRVIR